MDDGRQHDCDGARTPLWWARVLHRRCRRYNAGLKREIDAVIASELERDDPRPPSIFMSLSCAEFYWKPMLEYLSKHIAAVEGGGDSARPVYSFLSFTNPRVVAATALGERFASGARRSRQRGTVLLRLVGSAAWRCVRQ